MCVQIHVCFAPQAHFRRPTIPPLVPSAGLVLIQPPMPLLACSVHREDLLPTPTPLRPLLARLAGQELTPQHQAPLAVNRVFQAHFPP